MASVRTSWATVLLDPNPHVTGNEQFQRAISGDMTLVTDAVVNSSHRTPFGSTSAPSTGGHGQSVVIQMMRVQAR